MDEISDESVHLVITSPPYWQLKDYGSKSQIGYHDSYENYINNLNLVWKECFRILEKGCRLCVNIGDQFSRSVYYGRYKVIPIRTEIIKFCESIGFDYMGAIIWQKATTTNTTGGASVMGSFPFPRNGIISIDYEFILLFKKLGKPRTVDKAIKNISKMTKEEWKEYFSGHWNFKGEKQDGHIAMFPEELPRRLIKMFAFIGDTVVDPFLGSGTTALAAKNTGRNSIGYEINPDFIPFLKKKLKINQPDIFGTKYEFFEQKKITNDFKKEISQLPYIFRDSHKLDKKIDPKKLQFGSRIDNNRSQGDNYYSVVKIESPNTLILNTGIRITLIGVKPNKEKKSEALAFLDRKTKRQKVYMKYDSKKYDDEGNLRCYMYLKNRTFINGHLIRSGYVDFDQSEKANTKFKFYTK